ncbi:MAG: LOG family protein [Acidobacteriia bacterium]|nr:LOG family protein [Terriglobia bacterium]
MFSLPDGVKKITVFGGRHPVAGDAEYAEAFRLGSLLAAANYAVMSGGYSGVMEAVSRGAIEAGGTAIGVTMEIFGNLAPNPFLTHEIRSRNFFERLEILASNSSGFIAMRGGMGTLTEISLIWNMLQTKTMPDKPVILVGRFWKSLLQSVAGHLVISPEELEIFHYVDSADEAVARLSSLDFGRSDPIESEKRN